MAAHLGYPDGDHPALHAALLISTQTHERLGVEAVVLWGLYGQHALLVPQLTILMILHI